MTGQNDPFAIGYGNTGKILFIYCLQFFVLWSASSNRSLSKALTLYDFYPKNHDCRYIIDRDTKLVDFACPRLYAHGGKHRSIDENQCMMGNVCLRGWEGGWLPSQSNPPESLTFTNLSHLWIPCQPSNYNWNWNHLIANYLPPPIWVRLTPGDGAEFRDQWSAPNLLESESLQSRPEDESYDNGHEPTNGEVKVAPFYFVIFAS